MASPLKGLTRAQIQARAAQRKAREAMKKASAGRDTTRGRRGAQAKITATTVTAKKPAAKKRKKRVT